LGRRLASGPPSAPARTRAFLEPARPKTGLEKCPTAPARTRAFLEPARPKTGLEKCPTATLRLPPHSRVWRPGYPEPGLFVTLRRRGLRVRCVPRIGQQAPQAA